MPKTIVKNFNNLRKIQTGTRAGVCLATGVPKSTIVRLRLTGWNGKGQTAHKQTKTVAVISAVIDNW